MPEVRIESAGASDERTAAASPLEKLSLAVYAHNLPALSLYRALGFQEEGRRVGEYRFADGSLRDDVLMALPVRD